MSNKMKFLKFEEEEDKLVTEYYRSNLHTGYLNCEGYMLPDLFPIYVDEILDFNIRDDDTWVCSYPKSGTTWTQETVWCIANDLNFKKSKEINLSQRFPFLDVPFVVDAKKLVEKDPLAAQRFGMESKFKKINGLESPRFVKSHLPIDFMPLKLQQNFTKAKIIYITRNPRDTCISQFHHSIVYEGFQGTFEQFADLFLKGLVPYGPYWKHIFSFWNQRNNLNILFIKFEDMKTDLQNTIQKISKFLNHNLTPEEIDQLSEHVTFDNMKNNKSVNKQNFTNMMKKLNNIENNENFMRCGQTNQWRNKMSPELIQQFEQWEKENLKNTDYILKY